MLTRYSPPQRMWKERPEREANGKTLDIRIPNESNLFNYDHRKHLPILFSLDKEITSVENNRLIFKPL